MSPNTHSLAAAGPDGLARVGRTLHDLRGIRFNEGDGGNAPATEPAPAAAPAAPAPAAPAEPAPPAVDPAAPWTADDFDPERAWKKIQAQKADLDAEKAKRAQAVKDAETAAERRAAEKAYKEIGKTLGVVTDDETPTVEGLSQALQEKDATLSTAQADNQALRIENAILRHADKVGADADALTDSESFKKKLKDLDPTDDDHDAQVAALVKAEVEANPRFRKVQVAPKSSNGDAPPAGGTPAPTAGIESHRAAYAKRREARD